jgi:membrane protein implicated in regulation of membrane protease activity
MEKIIFPLALTSLVLVMYCLACLFLIPFPMVISLFLGLHVLLLWMVYRVLKDGTPSKYTFDEKWYEDQ